MIQALRAHMYVFDILKTFSPRSPRLGHRFLGQFERLFSVLVIWSQVRWPVPSSVSGSHHNHPLTSSRPPSPQYALHHQPNHTIPNQDTLQYLSWASRHYSLHYIINSTPLGSPHPLCQTIHCFFSRLCHKNENQMSELRRCWFATELTASTTDYIPKDPSLPFPPRSMLINHPQHL